MLRHVCLSYQVADVVIPVLPTRCLYQLTALTILAVTAVVRLIQVAGIVGTRISVVPSAYFVRVG